MKPLPTNEAGDRIQAQQPTRVLLYVEDEEENRNVATLRLKKYFEILIASNSEEACEILKSRCDDIEAILMDIELKGSDLDGIMLTKLIRGKLARADLPNYTKDLPILDTPILFVTAYGDHYPEKTLLQVGGDLLIRKPVDFLQLTMALTQIRLKHSQMEFEKRRKDSLPVEYNIRTPRDQPKKRVILYIEDDEKNRNTAMLRLQNAFELLLASNDREACEILGTRGTEIEAILLDIELKGSKLNGIEIAKLIRGKLKGIEIPSYAKKVPALSTPIFYVTAYGNRYSDKELTQAGGNRVIRKPVDFVQLKMALTLIHLEQEKRNCTP